MTITLEELEALTAKWLEIHAPVDANFSVLVTKHTGFKLDTMGDWTQIPPTAQRGGGIYFILKLKTRKNFRRNPIVACARNHLHKWTVKIIPKGTL